MAAKLQLPLAPYDTGDYLRFGQTIRRRGILWATHLGDDVVAAPGMPVHAIGNGEVVWAQMRRGSPEKRNWGGIVIVAHSADEKIEKRNSKLERDDPTIFYSVYGHMKDVRVKQGGAVAQGDVLGVVAEGNTPENGYWKEPHLHFAMYTGPWKHHILPGYARPDDWLRRNPRRTRRRDWHDPRSFIDTYNLAIAASSPDTEF